uniref:Uncharacterized protein n=1 Tax=Glossina palpalis gambiensis TaxID=67801 RepID=A0A1B0BVE9_9MUSC
MSFLKDAIPENRKANEKKECVCDGFDDDRVVIPFQHFVTQEKRIWPERSGEKEEIWRR